MFDRLRQWFGRAANRQAAPTSALLKSEMAAPSLTGVRKVWHESMADNLSPSRLASILRSAAWGDADDYLTLAEEMEERDLHYASVLATRKLAVAGLDLRVEAASDDAVDVQRADLVRALSAAPEFGELVAHLTDALGKGYAVVELVWDRSGSVWQPSYVARDPRFFQYAQEDGHTLLLRDEADVMRGVPLPPYKFVVHTPKIRSGLPIRGGLARLAAVAYLCKAWTWRDWMAFADIYGLPMRVGKYGPSASKEDIGKLMSAVANLGSDAAAVMPDSMRIEFEQAAQTVGAGEFFRVLSEFWDKQVSKAVLGQTMTADDGASMSQAKVHNEVRLDLLRADAKAMQNTLNRELIRPYVDLNFGDGRYPLLVLQVPEPEDTKLLVEALAALVPLGLEVEQSVIRDKLGLPDPAPDAALLRVPKADAEPAPPAVNRALNAEAVPADPTPVTAQTAALATQIEPAWNEVLDQIRALVDAAPDLPSLRDALLSAYADLPTAQLSEVMAMAMAAAELAGRYDAVQESADA